MAERTPHTISRPVVDRTIKIQSEQALRVVRRVFRPLVRSLYAIDVILRIIGEEAGIDAVEEAVSKMFSDCARDLEREKARMEKLCTDNGVTEKPRYTHPMDFTAHIVLPQVAQFVALIQMLDELMITLDALWLTGVLNNKQCGQAHYQWQQRLLRLGRRIITIERRAHRAAYEKGHGEEVKAVRESSGLAAEPEAIPDLEGSNSPSDDSDPSSAETESDIGEPNTESLDAEFPEGSTTTPATSGWRRLAGL
ncbi:hypothetical protein [Methylocaldum szegediense]|uniref:Uncharacterized protein n=1 Tax=Methylocaldum szegediense TaxID=73780 RepID=A0ABM9HYD8_9GAMM|nr:hypothetical protein [Methylocaldum szegediense]CAI8769178.1 conserved protein of unknown function [Methylocaldum szegediense]